MTQNPPFFCSKCLTTRAPLFAGRKYTCVMCGKSRTPAEFRDELAELRAVAQEFPVPAPALVAAPEPTPPPVPVAAPATPAVRPTAAAAGCAWKDCGEAPRAKSKYCSRSCSNKNARWRHGRRGATDEDVKLSA